MRGSALVALLAGGLLLSGCTDASDPRPQPTTGATSQVAPATAQTPTPAPRPSRPTMQQRAAALVATMTPAERAGQVLMTAATVSDLPGTASLVRRYHLAGVMVRGRSAAGTRAVHHAFAPARAAAPHGLPLLTATDQEGGAVQVLTGPGFATIPSAVEQGHWSVAEQQSRARRWGASLRAAGVNLDLAPVADVPCASTRYDNPPIADLDREYGLDPKAAGRHVAAVVRGLRASGVASTVKHFPGLGCVRANTDTATRVVDTVTTPTSARLAAFRAGIDANARFVMMSSAVYTRIDPHAQALFSARTIGGLLRRDLGFDGVVMSDDVGGAASVKHLSAGRRVTRFVAAGGDLMLDIVPGDLPAMSKALTTKAAHEPAFAAALTAAAQRVVAARLAAK